MTEQEARKAAEKHCVEHLDGDCCEIAAHMWHAALEWARTQQGPVGEMQESQFIPGLLVPIVEQPLSIGTKLYATPVAPTVPQWQPIETAPRDGSRVLIYMPEASRLKVREACWAIPWEGAPNEQCYWVTPHGPAGRGYTILPEAVTHWMPLPAAPEYKESE